MLRKVSDSFIVLVSVVGLSACQSDMPAATARCAELSSLMLADTTITLEMSQ